MQNGGTVLGPIQNVLRRIIAFDDAVLQTFGGVPSIWFGGTIRSLVLEFRDVAGLPCVVWRVVVPGNLSFLGTRTPLKVRLLPLLSTTTTPVQRFTWSSNEPTIPCKNTFGIPKPCPCTFPSRLDVLVASCLVTDAVLYV
jgi:hypothetical protein